MSVRFGFFPFCVSFVTSARMRLFFTPGGKFHEIVAQTGFSETGGRKKYNSWGFVS